MRVKTSVKEVERRHKKIPYLQSYKDSVSTNRHLPEAHTCSVQCKSGMFR